MRKKVLVVSFTIVVFCIGALTSYRFLFLHFIRVPTASMANTVIAGDSLVVRKRAFGNISRGDVIVFRYIDDLDTYYLSRVVGLPGETLEMRERIVYVDGKELAEQRVTVKLEDFSADSLVELSNEGTGNYRVFYEGDRDSTRQNDPNGPFRIPDNQYFVMSDNRDECRDSRYRGPVPKDLIFGKPLMIYWSTSTGSAGKETIRWGRIFSSVK